MDYTLEYNSSIHETFTGHANFSGHENSCGHAHAGSHGEGLFGFDTTFVYPVAACYIVIVVVAVISKLMVCYAILSNRNLRNNLTNLFLSLAVADFLTVTLAAPFEIESLFPSGLWKHGKIMCITWLTVYLMTVPTSILTLLAISIDRFKTLRDPLGRFRRSQFITQRRSLIVIAAIWFYCIVWALLPIMGWRDRSHEPIYKGACMVPYTLCYSTLISVMNFIFPLLLTRVFYILIYTPYSKMAAILAFFCLIAIRPCSLVQGKIFFSISIFNFEFKNEATRAILQANKRIVKWRPFRNKVYLTTCKHSKLTKGGGLPSNIKPTKEESKMYSKNLKAARTTSMFVVAIFFCWQPFSHFSIISNFVGHKWDPYPFDAYVMLLILSYLNLALNPFLFAFCDESFKGVYRKLFRSIRPAPSNLSSRSIRRGLYFSQRTSTSEIPEEESIKLSKK